MNDILHNTYVAWLAKIPIDIDGKTYNPDEIDIEIIDEEKEHFFVKVYYPDGTQHKQFRYNRGCLNGKCIIWHKNGNKKIQRNYNHGKLDGIEYKWLSNGKLWEKNTYVNGELQKDGENVCKLSDVFKVMYNIDQQGENNG